MGYTLNVADMTRKSELEFVRIYNNLSLSYLLNLRRIMDFATDGIRNRIVFPLDPIFEEMTVCMDEIHEPEDRT